MAELRPDRVVGLYAYSAIAWSAYVCTHAAGGRAVALLVVTAAPQPRANDSRPAPYTAHARMHAHCMYAAYKLVHIHCMCTACTSRVHCTYRSVSGSGEEAALTIARANARNDPPAGTPRPAAKRAAPPPRPPPAKQSRNSAAPAGPPPGRGGRGGRLVEVVEDYEVVVTEPDKIRLLGYLIYRA